MLLNKKILCAPLAIMSMISMPAISHEAGDIIIRAGIAQVAPSESSDVIQPTIVSPDGRVSIDNDTQLGLTATYMLSDNWGIEVLAATPFKHTVSFDGDLAGLGSLATAEHLPPTVSVQYFFDTNSNFMPYVGAGVNYTWVFDADATANGVAVLDSIGTGGDYEISASNSFGLSWELGFDYQLNDNFMLNAAVWNMDIDTTIYVAHTVQVDLDIDPWVYMVGIGYKF